MLYEVKGVLSRSSATLAQDFIGCGALVMLLVAVLYLPGLV